MDKKDKTIDHQLSNSQNLSENESQKICEINHTQKQKEKQQPILTIIHFNDVYDVDYQSQNSLGFVNFKAKIDELKSLYPSALILFSGDCFYPSKISRIKNGVQMVHCLNTLKIDAACYGNHEFDCSAEQTQKLSKACNFDWLLANIYFKDSGKLLGNGKPTKVISVGGHKIGIIGLGGIQWKGILADKYPDMLQCSDPVEVGQVLARELRQTQKCDIVIALTHQSNLFDLQFPVKVKNVDLVLGGHQHGKMKVAIQQTIIVKSGSNFNNVGLINFYNKSVETELRGRNFNFEVEIFAVKIALNIDNEIKTYIDEILKQCLIFDKIIGYTDVALEMRGSVLRTQETNYGNFLADLVRIYFDTHVAAINSGSVRNDTQIPQGKLSFKQLQDLIDNVILVKKVSGSAIIQMLERSVHASPNAFGGFLMVSGLQFEYDWSKTPRVSKVRIRNKELQKERMYDVAVPAYIGRGGQGYEMLKNSPTEVNQSSSIQLSDLILKFFTQLDHAQDQESINGLKGMTELNQIELPDYPIQSLQLVSKLSVRVDRIRSLRPRCVLNHDGRILTCIAPKVEGRVKCITKIIKETA